MKQLHTELYIVLEHESTTTQAFQPASGERRHTAAADFTALFEMAPHICDLAG